MALRVVIIAIFAYALAVPDLCYMLARYWRKDADIRETDYPHLLKRYGWKYTLVFLAADFCRALIAILIGAAALSKVGFPNVGRMIALFFVLIAQLIPIICPNNPRQDPVLPALALLCVDWKLFLICVVLALIAVALTGSKPLMMLTGAVAFPLFTLIFGRWWLIVILAILCAGVFVYKYYPEIRTALSEFGRKKPARRPRPVESDTQDPQKK